jgi:microcystin-dependent protein
MSKNLEEIRGFKNAAIGTIMAWGGGSSDLPPGWLACDGGANANDDYPLLKAVIGYTYGGSDASGQFQVPDLNNGKIPFHKGSTYVGDSNNNSGNVSLNADWSINGRPNKVIQYSSSTLTGNATGQMTSSNSIFRKQIHYQSRIMSLENLPGHGHNPNIKALNSQHTGNPSGESGSDITFQTARSIINRQGAGVKIGGPNDFENNRMTKPPQAHGHESMQIVIDKGSMAINSYSDTYNSDNMSVNNYDSMGNAILDFTQPHQTAVYMIKAY